MDQIIKALAEKLNLPEATVRDGVGVILKFIKEKAPGSQFEQLLNLLPGAGALIASAPAGGEGAGAGGLLGGLLGKALGGLGENFGGTAETIGSLQKAGVPLDKIGPLASGFLSQAKEVAGEDVVNEIIDKTPALQALKDLLKR